MSAALLVARVTSDGLVIEFWEPVEKDPDVRGRCNGLITYLESVEVGRRIALERVFHVSGR